MLYNPGNLKVLEMHVTGSYCAETEIIKFIYQEGRVNIDSSISSLPDFLSETDKGYFVLISNPCTTAVNFTAREEVSWIEILKKSEIIDCDERIWVSVNWDRMTEKGINESQILFIKQKYILQSPDLPILIQLRQKRKYSKL